jgi:hypothetical protein
MLKTAFSTEQGDNQPRRADAGRAIFALHVDKVTPPQVRPLAEVRDKAVAAGRRTRNARRCRNRLKNSRQPSSRKCRSPRSRPTRS